MSSRSVERLNPTFLANGTPKFSMIPEFRQRVHSKRIPKFRKRFPEFLPFHSVSDRKSLNFWSNGKRPPFVGERVFQNRGVCGQAFPSFPSPTPLLPPFFLNSSFARPEFRSRRTGTLATQAKFVLKWELEVKRVWKEGDWEKVRTLTISRSPFCSFLCSLETRNSRWLILIEQLSLCSRCLDQPLLQHIFYF